MEEDRRVHQTNFRLVSTILARMQNCRIAELQNSSIQLCSQLYTQKFDSRSSSTMRQSSWWVP